MRARSDRAVCIASAAMLVMASPAAAQTASDVCRDGLVDKDLLAAFLLDRHGVSRATEAAAARYRAGENAGLSTPRYMLSDVGLCDRMAADGASCGADARKLQDAHMALAALLAPEEAAFDNVTGEREPAEFLASSRAILRCVSRTAEDNSPNAAPPGGGGSTELVPFRVRGNADSLAIHRDDAEFKAADGAKLKFTDDHEANKQVEEFALVLGRPFELVNDSNQFAELVPYVGINRNVSEVTGQPASTTVDTWQVGAQFSTRLRRRVAGDTMTHWFTFRPDYSGNDFDGSRLLTLNVGYMPVFTRGVNDYVRLDANRNDFISYRPILEFSGVFGDFTDQGLRTDDESRAIARAGVIFGVTFTSDNRRLPLDLTVTDTWLASLNDREDLEYFRSKLALALDPDRVFSLELNYVTGQRSDLVKEEESWSVGFSAKY